MTTPAATTETWTIQRLLAWTRDFLAQKGSPSPRVDAERLLGETLGLKRLDLLLRFDQPVQKDELAAFKARIQRRARGEPVAYILGYKGFYGLDLRVGPAVLVPRPETETLVDEVLAFLRQPDAPAGDVLDLCTGSGAIALAVADALQKPVPDPRKPQQEPGPVRQIVATDLSPEALAVARENAETLGLRTEFRQGDLFAVVPERGRFAVLASNPPYVKTERLATLDRDVRDFEPHLALDGGADGMSQLQVIAAHAAAVLVPGGLCAVELGSREQGAWMVAALAAGGLPGGVVAPIQGGPTCLVTVRAG